MPSYINTLTEKVLHIDRQERYRQIPQELSELARKAGSEIYLEDEPTVREWLKSLVPTKQGASKYIRSLFPCAQWIPRYNLRWLFGDAVAGVTIGLVIVPQAMAYALLAGLSPEYGLYTSFTGAALYWLFGTSRDIVIGTTAVGSLLVGSAISAVEAERGDMYSREEIAKALSVIGGAILLLIGLLRLGWIIEFIPYVPISAFVTSASITIMSTQFPVVMGITGINTREAPYIVIINTLKALGRTKVDAAIGLSSIVLLFIIRDLCAMMEARQPSRKRLWASASSMRLTFVMLLFTLISWLVHRTSPSGVTKFRLVGTIESGFKHVGVPRITADLATLVLPELPAIIIILVIEHVAIAKSFGRTLGYTIIPSQEIIAQGASNVLGSFLGGYACTGSFGASAVLSKSGVRTPFAGVFGALMLILALYALTAVFYYIPMAALAGLIIHAVSNLMTPPKALYRYWQLSPLELCIWVIGVILAIFTSLEISIYVTISVSMAIVLVRLARTKGQFLGQVRVHRICVDGARQDLSDSEISVVTSTIQPMEPSRRTVFLPVDRQDASNPAISVESPYPGVFIYRFAEGFNYINQLRHLDTLRKHVLANTRRTALDDDISPSERLWCNAPPAKKSSSRQKNMPCLKAIVLDFSAVNNIDITSIQGLIDLRNVLDAYAKPGIVEWHLASVHNRWTRRALAVAGFGYPSAKTPAELGNWIPVYSVAGSLAGATQEEVRTTERRRQYTRNAHCEGGPAEKGKPGFDLAHDERQEKWGSKPVYGIDRPFFHVDLLEAIDTAVRDARAKDYSDSESSTGGI